MSKGGQSGERSKRTMTSRSAGAITIPCPRCPKRRRNHSRARLYGSLARDSLEEEVGQRDGEGVERLRLRRDPEGLIGPGGSRLEDLLVGGIVPVLEPSLQALQDAIVEGQRAQPEPEHAAEARAGTVGILEILLSGRRPDPRGPFIGGVQRPAPPCRIRVGACGQAPQEGVVLFVPVSRLQGQDGALEPGV